MNIETIKIIVEPAPPEVKLYSDKYPSSKTVHSGAKYVVFANELQSQTKLKVILVEGTLEEVSLEGFTFLFPEVMGMRLEKRVCISTWQNSRTITRSSCSLLRKIYKENKQIKSGLVAGFPYINIPFDWDNRNGMRF